MKMFLAGQNIARGAMVFVHDGKIYPVQKFTPQTTILTARELREKDSAEWEDYVARRQGDV